MLVKSDNKTEIGRTSMNQAGSRVAGLTVACDWFY